MSYIIIDAESLPIEEKNEDVVESLIKSSKETHIVGISKAQGSVGDVVSWYAEIPNGYRHHVKDTTSLILRVAYLTGHYRDNDVSIYTKNEKIKELQDFSKCKIVDRFEHR